MGEGEKGLLAPRLKLPADLGRRPLFLEPVEDEAARRLHRDDLAAGFEAFILAEFLRHLLVGGRELAVVEYEGEASAGAKLHLSGGEPFAAQVRAGEVIPDALDRRGQQPLEADGARFRDDAIVAHVCSPFSSASA